MIVELAIPRLSFKSNWLGELLATKDQRREAFGGILSASLARVVDFLKFAETKNAALLTFASAWTLALINLLTGDRAPAGILGAALWLALILFSATAAVAIKNHQLSWWFDGEPLKAVLKDSATFGMGLWDH